MALRYLEDQGPQYVPTYTKLNPELLSRASQGVERQVQTAKQAMRGLGFAGSAQPMQQTQDVTPEDDDTLSIAGRGLAGQFSNLSQQDQQYAVEQVNQSRQRLSELAQSEGYRDLMPYVQDEANRVQQNLQYHRQASQAKKQALQKLQTEDSQAPSYIKNKIQQDIQNNIGVQYNEEGEAVGANLSYNSNDLTVAANWQDWTDDVQEQVNNLTSNPDVQETPFQQDTMQTGEGTVASGTMSRRQVEGVSEGRLERGVANFLQSNPQYREQLQLLGKMEFQTAQQAAASDDEIENPFTKNADGTITVEQTVYKRDSEGNILPDKNGDPIPVKKNKEYNSFADYQAHKIGKNYSDNAYTQVSYTDVRNLPRKNATETSGDNAEDDQLMTSRLSVQSDNRTFPEYMVNAAEQEKKFNQEFKKEKSEFVGLAKEMFGGDFEGLTVTEDRELEIKIGSSGTATNINDLAEPLPNGKPKYTQYGLDEIQFNSLQTLRDAVQMTKRKADIYEKNIDQAQRAIKNNLGNLEGVDRSFIQNHLQINDDGSVSFQNLDQMEEVPESIVGSRAPEILNFQGKQLNSFKQSNKQEAVLTVESGGSSDPTVPGRVQNIYARKNDDGSIEYRRISESFNGAYNKAQENVYNRMANKGEFDTVGFVIPENDPLRDTIKSDNTIATALGNGNFTSAETGDQVTYDVDEGNTFDPTRMYLGENGQPVLEGAIEDVDDNPVEQVRWTGETASSFIRQKLGSQYDKMIADQTVNSILPDIYNKQEVQLDSQALRSMGASSRKNGTYRTLPDASIEAHRQSGGRMRFKIKANGKKYYASDKQGILDLLRKATVSYYDND